MTIRISIREELDKRLAEHAEYHYYMSRYTLLRQYHDTDLRRAAEYCRKKAEALLKKIKVPMYH
jgi:epoxyqueuosine reductase QueG